MRIATRGIMQGFLSMACLATGFGQSCSCYTYVAVDKSSGIYISHSETRTNNVGAECWICTATVFATHSAAGQVADYSESDNVSQGWAVVDIWGSVILNQSYSTIAWHSYGFSSWTSSFDQVNIPTYPNAYPGSVEADGSGTAHISFSLSSNVLYSASLGVAGQFSTANGSTQVLNFPFYQSSLPPGTSYFTLWGYRYGYTFGWENIASVNRSDGAVDDSRVFGIQADLNPPQFEFPTYQTYQPYSKYSYSTSSSGGTTVVTGGVASVSNNTTPGVNWASINATHTVGSNVYSMSSPPSSIPPQSSSFVSVNRSGATWVAPGTAGEICAAAYWSSPLGGQIVFPGCLGGAIP